MIDVLDGLGDVLQSVRGMLAGPGQLEGSIGAGVLNLINDSLELLEEIEAEAPKLSHDVAWLRRRFFAAGVTLEDLSPGFQYFAADRITRRPVLAIVARKLTTRPSAAAVPRHTERIASDA